MKQILIGTVLFAFVSCGNNEFCGQPCDESEISNLKEKVVDDNGVTASIQMAFAIANEFGEDSEINTEIIYSVQDTVVMNFINIPDEKTAKKISCIVAKNETVKEIKVVYARFIIGETTKAFKY